MTNTNSRAAAMTEGRRADTARRRQRVLTALTDAANAGNEITVSSIAQRAAVDRTFLYRHRDLLDQLHVLEAQPPRPAAGSSTASRASLESDLLAAQHRAVRLGAHAQQLERRLSTLMGEQTWRDSGLGAPDDLDRLHQRITTLEAEIADTRLQLDERTDELAAARLANRELITRLNTPRPRA